MTANRFTTRPLWLRLRDVLAERVASGTWRAGAIIPNERDLAREFDVSPATMRKALDLLESEGVLTRKQGRGTYVNGQGDQERAIRFRNIVAANRDPIAARVRLGPITAGPATELECARLSLPPQQEVYRIQRVHHYGDGPLMLDVASLPVDLFPGLLERQQTAESVTLLAQGYGILLGRAKERVSVGVAHATHAQALQIAAGSSVLILDRVVVALTGRPVEWRLAYCNGNNQCYVAKSD